MRGTKTTCFQCFKMAQLCWSMLLLCLSANAENIAVYQEPGKSITLECSAEGCPRDTEGSHGMYLYYMNFTKQVEVLYYFSKPGYNDKVSPQGRYKNRIQMNGPLKKHNITISNLTVADAGFYRCVYLKDFTYVYCSAHTVFVGDLKDIPLLIRGFIPLKENDILQDPISGVSCVTAEKSPSLVLVIVTTCAISMLVIMILILLITPRVKRWISIRRTRPSQVPNEYVYEVMTKNGLQPLAAPTRSPPSPYDLS